ncbi:retrotransposon gag domain-containing protein [Artemisia annua]|uniref:Retrotransposon gag domain-containing protein n=1 Tax=Artemisia annua TaxID=35608 RepID=A0A2U1M5Q3_ARTAN|nr:retrotransposon gag domain-containing protein [Artemisia annua]
MGPERNPTTAPSNDKIITMTGDNSIQTPAQEAIGDPDEPRVEPTRTTHDAGRPGDPTSEPDTEDPVIQFVVHNFDRMNAMYKAFTQKLKDAPHQRVFANVDPPIIEPLNSDSDELHLREPRRETKQHMTYKDLPRRPRDKQIVRPATRQGESHRFPRETFTALIKSPAEILATSKGKMMLRPPPKMFTPASRRDKTKYCEFHEDHGHDTNDCIDLRKQIEACVRNGRLAHLAKEAKVHNSSQNNQPPWSKDGHGPQVSWSKKTDDFSEKRST